MDIFVLFLLPLRTRRLGWAVGSEYFIAAIYFARYICIGWLCQQNAKFKLGSNIGYDGEGT